MARRAIVFAGTDGHGACMGVISRRNLRAEGYETTLECRYPETGRPSQFWGQTFVQADLHDYEVVVVVDIPLPEPDGIFPNAVPDALTKIRELTAAGTRVVIVDHHKVTESHYGRAREAGAEVVLTSTASSCFYGAPTNFSERWGRLGAICDLDDAVLPVTEEEESLALGIDTAVRQDLAAALEAIEADNVAYFADKGEMPEIPGKVQVVGNVAYADELTARWAFKQCGFLAGERGTDFAVGLNFTRGAAVHAVTHWKSNALPVALVLGLTRFIGHGKAIVLPVSQEDTLITRAQAQAKAWELIACINTGDPLADPGGEPNSLFGYVSALMRRVHIPEFLTLHGWGHVEHVVANARSLGSLFDLTEREQRLLDWAALFHDVGNGASTVYGVSEKEARERHHEFSAQMIREWCTDGLFRGILPDEGIEVVADLCLRHRKKMPLPEDPRMRLLCLLLRVADAMDIDSRRAQRNDEGRFYEDLDLPDESRPHWEGHRAIAALRLVANSGLVFQFVVTDLEKAAFQIDQFTQELAALTEFGIDWKVEVVAAAR